MSVDKIAVGIGGVAALLFIAWFFFGKRQTVVAVESRVRITVDGGYTPEAITIKRGRTVRLEFLRKDASSCLEEVVLPELGVRRHLALNETTPIDITADRVGEFAFSCGMNMYHGKIIVVE
ncbi:MAG: cupredoxin domain-containing protein [Chloroflexi bacterium]|nr:cupredoxin domain-containing protein [Chloroflexota bacterium]